MSGGSAPSGRVGNAAYDTGGMRFDQFTERDYTLSAFISDATDNSLRLVMDYRRYSGRHQFCIEFEAFPRFACMWYQVCDEDGKHPNGGFSLPTICPVPMILCVANNDLIVANNNVKSLYTERKISLYEMYVKSLDMKNHCL